MTEQTPKRKARAIPDVSTSVTTPDKSEVTQVSQVSPKSPEKADGVVIHRAPDGLTMAVRTF